MDNNNRKIIAILRPFEPFQQVFVFKDGVMTAKKEIDTNTFSVDLNKLIEENEITHIDFSGAKVYGQGLEKQIKELRIKEYGKDNLIFTYI